MRTNTLISISARAMQANQSALQTIGHNIANANVAGYSRQRVDLGTAQPQFEGGAFFGRGVDVQGVSRSYDAFLTRQATLTRSQSAHDAARSQHLSRLEAVFRPGEEGIGFAVGDFLNGMVDLANRPQDLASRQVVLGRAGDLATRFASAGAEFDAMQRGVNEELQTSVTQVNSLAARLADVNGQIAARRGQGSEPNDLLDQRDQLVSEISNFLQVTTIPADDGTLGVFIAGGQRLVLGTQAVPLTLRPDPFDRTRSSLAINEQGSARVLDEGLLASGSIGGLLRFQNQDLVTGRNLVGQLAASVAGVVNDQQALGKDLRNPPGWGGPIFGTGVAQALAASTNARDAMGNFVAQVGIAVEDARQLMPSEYELRHDAGAWHLTRLSDGVSRTIVSGDVVDGMRIDLGTPAPAVTDRFLLQPVTRAANGMQRVLDDPRGLAAASPVAAAVGSANTGTGTVAGLRVVDASVNPQLQASIAFTSDTGDYTWELRDAATQALTASGSGTWTPGEPIALNGFELDLAGAPRSGDTFTVAQNNHPSANNGNALAMAALRDGRFVGAMADGLGGYVHGATFTDAWAGALAEVGVRAQGAETSAEISQGMAAAAREALTEVTGVNLDEEAAKLMQFQQAYQAAAKAMQVAQSLFDTLLDATR